MLEIKKRQLTALQYQSLELMTYPNKRVVLARMQTLRRLSNLGVLTLHEDTGKSALYGLGAVIAYVKDVERFTIEGIKGHFRPMYSPGCFYPFVGWRKD